jgi:uncharacterized Tic20 family protein
VPVRRPPTGALAWGLGLLGLLFLPFANLVVSGVVMVAVGLAQSRSGGLARVNGRRAANWGLTVLLILAPCIALWITALTIRAEGFFPWGISVIVWGVLGIANLVAAIVGLVQANAGGEVRFPAIPFLR